MQQKWRLKPVRRSGPEEGVLAVAVVNEVPDEQRVRVYSVHLAVHLKQVLQALLGRLLRPQPI